MRQFPTAIEEALWSVLRCRGMGVEFRRQVLTADRYIVDFLAPAVRFIVEVDRDYHGRRRAADGCRDRKLARSGYRVLRLENDLVLRNLTAAVALIRAGLIQQP